MKYHAIIFDMDGTIIASDNHWDKATQLFLKRRAIQPKEEEEALMEQTLKGLGNREAMAFLKQMFNISESAETLALEYERYACELYEKDVRFIDGFLPFHATLDKHNLKYAVATNADDMTLLTTKKALPLEQLFKEHIYNISHVNYQGKPRPDIYLHAARQLAVEPTRCIAIEDSAHGIKAAKNANMFCIGINSHGSMEQLKEADFIINGYHEIILEELLREVEMLV